jgi:hypothetical protein
MIMKKRKKFETCWISLFHFHFSLFDVDHRRSLFASEKDVIMKINWSIMTWTTIRSKKLFNLFYFTFLCCCSRKTIYGCAMNDVYTKRETWEIRRIRKILQKCIFYSLWYFIWRSREIFFIVECPKNIKEFIKKDWAERKHLHHRIVVVAWWWCYLTVCRFAQCVDWVRSLKLLI